MMDAVATTSPDRDPLHVTLLSPTQRATPPRRTWRGPAARLFQPDGTLVHSEEPYQVLGGPGTGKTSLLVDLACAHGRTPGVSSDSVLLLTQSKRAAAELSEHIAAHLMGSDALSSQEPLIRTFHSYAYSLLCRIALAEGATVPRLLTGAEKDVIYREMLATLAEDCQAADPHSEPDVTLWPEWIQPALTTAGFARELRDVISRAAERRVDGAQLRALGEENNEPLWIAAGQFTIDFERIMLLRASVGVESEQAVSPALDAAELVGRVLEGLARHPDLAYAEKQRLDLILVDDAHHLDPQMAELIDVIRTDTHLTVLAGDPDQMAFGFRGADPHYLSQAAPLGSERRIVLSSSYRLTPPLTHLVKEVGRRLPNASVQWRELTPARALPPEGAPNPRIVIHDSAAAEAAQAADVLRRAHLLDGVPWADMAIICRTVGPHLPALRRALLAAGVPLRTDSADLPLTEQYATDGLLAVLEAVAAPCTPDIAEKLLTGMVGRADPGEVRALRRGLRREELSRGGQRDSATVLALLLTPPSVRQQTGSDDSDVDELAADLTEGESQPLQRVRHVIHAAWECHQQGGTAEEVLWEAWMATELADSWRVASLRGGVEGAQADRNLDAIMALFDAASDYVDRVPNGTVAGFVRYIRDQELPSLSRIRSLHTTDAVTIISATSAVGREWDTVVVCGIQEGEWPNLAVRGSLLRLPELVDRIAGVDSSVPVSRRLPQLADERRLFYAAVSRARRQLVLTAVSSNASTGDYTPSRFLDEIAEALVPPQSYSSEDSFLPEPQSSPYVLSLPSMVARLRSILCATMPFPGFSPAEWEDYQHHACEQLARLAQAGVPHAATWWAVEGVSTTQPLWDPTGEHGTVTLNPSAFEQLLACPLRWLLGRNGGDTAPVRAAQFGTLIHALVQAESSGVSSQQVTTALEEAWPALGIESPWLSQQEYQRATDSLENFRAWNQQENVETDVVGLETPINHVFTAGDLADYGITPEDLAESHATTIATTIPIRVTGRIDRLERDGSGAYVIVDFKTGTTVPTKADITVHPQLALYQLALSAQHNGAPVHMAKLVYLKPNQSSGCGERQQPALDDEDKQFWRLAIQNAAAATQGPTFVARENEQCRTCSVLESCPIHSRSVVSRRS